MALSERGKQLYAEHLKRGRIDDDYWTDPADKPAAENNGHHVGRHAELIPARDIADDIPVWAWNYHGRGRIQLGTLALFAGRPGAGKSTAARWFAAQASTGNLEGHWHHKPQTVAYIAPAEESIRYVIKPGLRAAGADLTRILFPKIFDEDKEVRLLSLLDEEQLTEQFIHHHVKIVIVDPVMSTISANVDINKNNETRAFVEPWSRIADRIDGVVLAVVHLRKQNGGDLVAAITGSSAFGEIARAIFGFAKDPDSDGDDRVMSQAKNSTGYEDLSLTYRITTEEVLTDAGFTAQIGAFEITGTSDLTAEDILNATGTTQGGSGREAKHWLEDYLLQQGRAPSKDVKTDGRKEGFSDITLKRAAQRLKVVQESFGYPRRTYWSLPMPVGSPSEEPDID